MVYSRGHKKLKKIFTVYILAETAALILCGCGSRENGKEDTAAEIENIQEIMNIQDIENSQGIDNNGEIGNDENSSNTEDEMDAAQEEKPADEEPQFSFAEFHNLEFWCTSGHGGWATILTINEDGSFSGEFFDGDLGVIGEGYPNGTMYQSNFTGQFTKPVKLNDYTYSMQISEMNYAEELGKEEIIDGMLYCYTDAYGMEGSEKFLIYLPGAPLVELPEEFRSWVDYHDLSNTTETELPFYALNNEPEQYGFYSFDIIEHIKESIASSERYTTSLENSIIDGSLDQTEINNRTKEIYDEWDYVLNDLWKVLQRIKDEEEMNLITAGEREWIDYKERIVAEAGEGLEGSSIQEMIMNQKAAELTKNRVYELMGLLD